MKKSLILPLLSLVMPFISSCGDGESSVPGLDPVNPVTPNKDQAMSSADQKEYLEKIALELMDKMPSSDFKEIADLAQYIDDTYIDRYDWDAVDEWGEAALEAAREALGTKSTETETERWGYYTYTYNYTYTNYKALILASNFTGHFTALNGKWNLIEANDLRFIFKDKAGKECIIKLETSGSVKKVYVATMDDWQDYESYWSSYTYVSNEYYDRTELTIGIPEKIIVTLTQGGSQVIKTTLNVKLDAIADEEFNIGKSSLSFTSTAELNNGYKVEVSQLEYKANKKVSASLGISKNGKHLVSATASTDVSGIPSYNLSELESAEDDMDDIKVTNAFVKFDVLGKVQMQGTISDVTKYANYLDSADANDQNEATFKSYINQANGLADINVFYDGKSTKQATIQLEPFVDETWNGRTWWTAEPVIYFYDGTSYSTFNAFFNETDFKKAIDAFKTFAEKYEKLLD